MTRKPGLVILLLTLLLSEAAAQTTFRGMVIDSVTVDALPGVHVKIKNSAKGTITDAQGVFVIQAQRTDTLLLTLVGYHTLEIPLLLEEDAMILRLRENVTMLKGITISSTRLQANTVTRTARVNVPKPLANASPVTSPFDYFSRWQREHRKLQRLIRENDRTITYLRVVSDQEIRESMMEQFELTENRYYDLLAQFNEQSGDLKYSRDPEEIVSALKSFLKQATR
jgi:hypothetical protein